MELKIDSVIEKVQLGDDVAMILKIETGAFAVLCEFEGTRKVCFSNDSAVTADVYRRCVELVLGGPGFCYIN